MSYTCLQYHIIFATKDRRPWLHADLMPRVVKYIGGIIRGSGGTLIEGNGPEDHLHLAAILPPTHTVADVLRDIKGGSSGWAHDEIPELRELDWQDGYSAFTVSQSIMPKVVEYIRNQQEHHKTVTFEDELREVLEIHGIPFDERYL